MKRETRVDIRLGYISSFGPNKRDLKFFLGANASLVYLQGTSLDGVFG
jgi:hypothetical protein